ncbi:MAG: FUSC family protein [Mycobacterium sp.]|nr:FUSC family protein [Mycobacterium sp.]
MLTPAGLWRHVFARIRQRDPEYDGARRALRAAAVIPVATGLGIAAGGPQSTLFALFGSIALLIVADFPGNLYARALSYTWLGCVGALLITVGSLVAQNVWLAVSLTFVIATAVSFAGVLSESIAAGQRSVLLAFVLPVCVPAGGLGHRLVGWLIAFVICVPAALFVLPPRHHDELRRRAAQVCRTLVDRINGVAAAADVAAAMNALRSSFLGTTHRPVALNAGSRVLVRVIDDLQWLSDRTTADTAELLGPMAQPGIRVLEDAARTLDAADAADRDAARAALASSSGGLRTVAADGYRSAIVDILAETDDAAAIQLGRTLLHRRTMGAAIGVTGKLILAAATADARPVWARVLGRRMPDSGMADQMTSGVTAVISMTAGYLKTRAVTVRNSLRTGVGLSLAVALTFLFPLENGLWVVLGTMSVLRSSALATGTSVVRAVIGTVIGIAIGAVVIGLLGVDPVVMWLLLPPVCFAAAYVPEIGSFAAGQAAFTMLVLIVFNLVVPTGWQLGLIRLQDVALGASVAVIASVLLWPRGATAWVESMIDTTCVVGARYLRSAVFFVTQRLPDQTFDSVRAHHAETVPALRTMDDAVRYYLSESGGPTDSRSPMLYAANRAWRLRTAADLVADVVPPPPDLYPQVREVLETHATVVCARLDGSDTSSVLPPISDDFVPALRAQARRTGKTAVATALPLLTVAAHLGELELTYPPLENPVPGGVL